MAEPDDCRHVNRVLSRRVCLACDNLHWRCAECGIQTDPCERWW